MNCGIKRICLVGLGRWGANHARTLHKLGCLAGIVESSGERRSRASADFPGVALYASVEESFSHTFDGYVVATPASTHYEVGQKLLVRGLPTLIEKPLALSVAHACELKRLSMEHGATLMVGHLLLFHPAIRAMKELVTSGELGSIHYLYSNRLNLGTVRTDENILWSFAPHDVALFFYFLGAAPAQVTASGGAFLQPKVHDITMMTLKYSAQVMGHIFVSWLHPFKEHRFVIVGSKGMLVFEDAREEQKVKLYRGGIDLVNGVPVTRNVPCEVVDYPQASPLEEELKYFMAHLENTHVGICSADNGIEVLETLERASRQLASTGACKGGMDNSFEARFGSSVTIHPSCTVDEEVKIGAGTKIWHYSHIQRGAQIGEACVLGQNVNVSNQVKIGSRVKIQNNVSIYEGVELEDEVFCGPSCVFTNVSTPRAAVPRRGAAHYEKTVVKRGATIGANATIVCGVTLGSHCFVGAGAVVTRDVPSHALVVGNPARRIGWSCCCGIRLKAEDAHFVCPSCGLQYREQEGQFLSFL